MTTGRSIPATDTTRFLVTVGALADSLGWKIRSFTRDGEFVVVAGLGHDPSFEQFLWIHGTEAATLRFLLVSRTAVPHDREGAILELCARINAGLVFGCSEYSFEERRIMFRNSVDLSLGPLVKAVESASARLLGLGARYAAAIVAVVAGCSPADAVTNAESAPQGAG